MECAVPRASCGCRRSCDGDEMIQCVVQSCAIPGADELQEESVEHRNAQCRHRFSRHRPCGGLPVERYLFLKASILPGVLHSDDLQFVQQPQGAQILLARGPLPEKPQRGLASRTSPGRYLLE